jgi:predicted acyltransferase
MLRKKLALLVAAAMMLASMLAFASVASAVTYSSATATATAGATSSASASASAAGAAQYQYTSALPGTGGVSPIALLAVIPAILLVVGGLLTARLIRIG